MTSKDEAVSLLRDWLDKLPEHFVCVECGFKLEISWRVTDGRQEDAHDHCLTVEPETLLDGWCDYSGDGGKDGLHCPKCYEARKV